MHGVSSANANKMNLYTMSLVLISRCIGARVVPTLWAGVEVSNANALGVISRFKQFGWNWVVESF